MSGGIRPAEPPDAAGIRAVHLAAFPTPAEADLVAALDRDGDTAVSLVGESRGEIVGHVLLSWMRATGDGRIYNGHPTSDITTAGARSNSVEHWRDGIVTRGVLYDIPRLRGARYVTTDEPVQGWELLDAAMAQGEYDLQALIYTLALHRWLRFRLGDGYDYARDVGGVRYLFCRGLDPARSDGPGVHARRFAPDLVLALDALFAMADEEAAA